MLGVVLCRADALCPHGPLSCSGPLHRTNFVVRDGQSTKCHHDGDCSFDATLRTCVSSTVSKLLAWQLEVKTGVADIRTCPTANVSDHLNQNIGDCRHWGNVPGLCDCGELNDDRLNVHLCHRHALARHGIHRSSKCLQSLRASRLHASLFQAHLSCTTGKEE